MGWVCSLPTLRSGHHMSKSAANMGGVLLAQELASKGMMVQMLHPGFNKTAGGWM